MTKKFNITVLGLGSWGTTLAVLLSNNGHNINIWDFDSARLNKINKTRKFDLIDGITIPKKINLCSNLKQVCENKDIIIFAVPSFAVRSVAQKILDMKIQLPKIFLSVVKGVEDKTFMPMSQIIQRVLCVPKKNVFVLSGPSHAEEVSLGIPTSVVIAGLDRNVTMLLQKIFSNEYFRVYTSSDIIGVEFGGAVKNIIAIAAGICDGLSLGDNTKAALITRGLAEMRRLAYAQGADKETLFGLSGLGDLVVTCTSRHSRNRFVGESIGRGKKLNIILKSMKMVAEGVPTTTSIFNMSKKMKISMPITDEVYKVLFKNKLPEKAVYDLMKRKLKSETL
jgi:glycerol-3-phosphate dehydrogenase (NAD(P)+)